MWFDAQSELQKIKNQEHTPATIARIAANPTENRPECSGAANVTAPTAQIPENAQTDEQSIFAAIRAGNARPGPIAVASGLGATVTYQLLDKLIASGRVRQARDGTLGVGAGEQ